MANEVPQFAAHWKTTVQGFLSAIISFALVAPTFTILTAKQVGTIVLAGGVAKAILSIFQKDAGTTEAKTLAGDVKAVPSHEVPDDPTSKAVIPKES